MAFPGSWTLFYDWDCDGSYGSTSMTVAANGNFTTGSGNSGSWVQGAGMVMFLYNNSKTTYAGNLASKSVTGVSASFTGDKGCFYMLQDGVPTAFVEERVAGKLDDSGNEHTPA